VLASNSFVLSFQNLSVPSISLSSMSTPTPPPASPNRSSTPLQLTADEELEAFMREPTPMLLEGDEHRVGEEEQQGSTGPAASPGFDFSDSVGIDPSSGPVRSNEHRMARQLAVKVNLRPYQKEALDHLVKVCLGLSLASKVHISNADSHSSARVRIQVRISAFSSNCVLSKTSLRKSFPMPRHI
jgi:hypothetical protein